MTSKQLQKKYGITLKERQRMFKEQKGKCALCGKHEFEFKRKLHIDHNHATGKVRGLVCYPCNRFKIGRLNLNTARAVYEYFVKYEIYR